MRFLRALFVVAGLAAPLAPCDDPETAVHYAPKQPRADRATALHGVAFAPLRALPVSPENASLAYAVAFELAMFAVALFLWRRRWFIKA